MFVDSDDWLSTDACEKAFNQISKNSDDMVFFGYSEFFDESGKIKKTDKNIKAFFRFYNGKSFHLYDMENYFLRSAEPWYKIYKKSFIDKYNIRFGNQKIGEDVPFYFKCIINAESVSVLYDYLYFYRKLDTSTTTEAACECYKDIFTSRMEAYEAVLNSKYCDKFLLLTLPYFINTVIYWYNRWSKIKGFPIAEYYKEMHRFLKYLREKHNISIEANKNYIDDYRSFNHFSKETYKIYKFKTFLKKIFSVYNKDKHKVINILGIKIKYKYNSLYKKYKKLNEYYKQDIKKIRNKVKNKKKIRVAFYVNDSRWKCRNLYDLLLKNENYEPFIIVGKHMKNTHLEIQNNDQLMELFNFFKNMGLNVYLAHDLEKNKLIPLENYDADIIFYSRPWGIGEEHSVELNAKNALICYVPYFISNSPASIEAGHDFHGLLWRYYVLNKDLKDEYSKIMANKGKNLKIAGYPNLDGYLDSEKHEKKYVIYAPHWSVGGNTLFDYGTFEWNGQYILEYAKKHPEINWVFRPHPILRNTLIEKGLMSVEEIDNYYNEWAKTGLKFDDADYIELFKKSKALITDCGSFLAEYMPSQSPVILLRSKKAKPYNFLAKKVTRYYYKVSNLEELEIIFEKILIKNRDFYLERRLDMLNKLHLVTNSSQNIINDFNKEFGI